MVGAYLIHLGGYAAAYAVDALTFTAALYALVRLPPLPPEGAVRRAGLQSVLEGLRFLHSAPNLRLLFVADLCAMVLAQPRALFPALALTVYLGTESTVGLLQSAPTAGAVVAFLLSGWGRTDPVPRQSDRGGGRRLRARRRSGRPQRRPVVRCLLPRRVRCRRHGQRGVPVLHTPVGAPDAMRGRLQGVFTVVVAGGPRAGEFLAGTLAELVGERPALLIGGSACVLGVLLAAGLQRDFLRYDARDPRH